MKGLILLAALGGCGFGSTVTDTPDGTPPPPPPPPVDAPVAIDAVVTDTALPPPDTMTMLDAQLCFGKGLVRVCFTTLPTEPITLTGTIDTGMDDSCTLRVPQGGLELCVIAGTSVTVSGTVTAIGARPLVILGIEDVTIESGGTIDVSSRIGVRRGAGANTGTCTTLTAAEDDDGGGGGGGGGGFGTAGGRGGVGDGNRTTRPDGTAAGGSGGGVQPASAFRGGCPGGKGGDSTSHAGAGGGDGGGAIYIIAGRTLTIAGNVYASGAGGGATNNNAGIEQGGGGGGAGGMIGLDAAALDIMGRVAANGGAGGGGGWIGTGGKPGGDGSTSAWNERATGGDPADGNNGAGGPGSAIDKFDMLTPRDGDGGGGGAGGGLGVVRIDGPVTGGAQISPAPTAR